MHINYLLFHNKLHLYVNILIVRHRFGDPPDSLLFPSSKNCKATPAHLVWRWQRRTGNQSWVWEKGTTALSQFAVVLFRNLTTLIWSR